MKEQAVWISRGAWSSTGGTQVQRQVLRLSCAWCLRGAGKLVWVELCDPDGRKSYGRGRGLILQGLESKVRTLECILQMADYFKAEA